MNQRLLLKLSERRQQFLLIIFTVAALCFCQSIMAQSGRRIKKNKETPAKPSATNSPAKSEKYSDSFENDTNVKISSITVVGESRNSSALFSYSSNLKRALKKCVKVLNKYAEHTKSGLIATKGKKMSFPEAIEKAKEENDTHLLWIEVVTKSDGYGNEILDFIDYALISPQTGKRLATGRALLRNTTVITPGDVTRFPTMKKGQPGRASSQIDSVAEEIIGRLVRWKWL